MSEEVSHGWHAKMREMLISQILDQWPEVVDMLIVEAKWGNSAEDRRSALQALMSLLQHFNDSSIV